RFGAVGEVVEEPHLPRRARLQSQYTQRVADTAGDVGLDFNSPWIRHAAKVGRRVTCVTSIALPDRESHLDGVDRPVDALLADRPRRAQLLGPQAHPQFVDLSRDVAHIL